MYLKELEIYGFKSFANKVKLPLKPGITCIVGPNGCGKSNVVDSLKWCIGEMSWKSLRMPSMMDVIFAGTTKRQALNMGEVAMTFDNESRKLPLDFSEVTVTRKIYRSEESEYFINKVQCRLKDIREMFLDTGIGTEGYAIIDQGEVEHVLSATAEERRELFEEAAGVSKYKAKRDEAARKLEKVEIDLNRLADSMVLLDEQIKKLDKEAARARLQQKYKEELTGAEIALLLRDGETFAARSAEAAARLEPIKKELAETAVAITSLEGEIAALNLTLVQKSEDQRVLKEAVSTVKTDKVQAEGRIVAGGNMLTEIASQREGLATSERRNAEKLAVTGPRIEELRAKLSSDEGGLPALQAEYEEAAAALARVAEQMRAADEAADNIAREMNEAYSREMEISNKIAVTGSNIGHFNDAKAGLEKDIEDINSAVTAIEAGIAELKARSAALGAELAAENEKAAAAETQSKALAARLGEIDVRQSEIREKKAWNQSRLEAILSQGEHDTYWVGINGVLNSGVAGVKGTLRHLLSIRKEDRVAVDDALGRYLDSVVCETAAAAQEAIDYLKHVGKGRCRFLILEKAPQAPAQEGWTAPGAQRLLEKISTEPQYLPLVTGLLSGVYASGGSVYGSFWVTGGVDEVVSNEPYWEEEGDLKEQIKKLDEESAALETEKVSLLPQLEGARAAADAAEEKAVALNIEFHKNATEAAGAEDGLRIKRESLALSRTELEKAEAGIRQAEADFAALVEGKAAAGAATETKKAEQAALGEKKNALHDDFGRQKEELGGRKANLDNYRQNLEAARAELSRAEGDLTSLMDEQSHFEERRSELAAREERYSGEIASSKARLSELMHDLAEKEIIDRGMEDELNEMRGNLARLAANLRDSRDVSAENDRIRYQIETELATIAARADETAKRMADEWNITPAEAKERYAGVQSDHDRVQFLRRRLAEMGNVNMTAPEEYEALTQRYNFMNSQVEDLNRAKADLRSAINKINDTTRENFKATFDKVSTYFKEIYSLLFNGGEANLILTMPENLLETGVEILAHPPGKKLVSISQLSGGEKALTALALLFSFFRVNPSPFCVMDEADAPLDEANVERFVRLIKEFAPTTQFIVITHNKRTMEAADTLYGVTMEELGVSKLIAVDLKRATGMVEQKAVGV
ncbi:MAG: chromosome segregation protein SMC [Elusimicrobia bacterium RIFCSPLOWO2_02_FULL_61_11]|nr:MAG: chromosome segregation protein SMC [Elusimicrobia bacterium RIFCSPLOWO2_02_FULL_61_11]